MKSSKVVVKLRTFLASLLALCLLFPLTGCRRTRIIGDGQQSVISDQASDVQNQTTGEESTLGTTTCGVTSDESLSDSPDDSEAGAALQENPDASRKEYDESAPVEIVSGTERSLDTTGEGNSAPTSGSEALVSSVQLSDSAEEAATQTVAAQEAEKSGVSEDAEAADSALSYYNVLLRDRLDSLFECQRLTIYWETAQDHITIHRSSAEHTLILDAGAYDASARLLPENLRIDDGWVVRKNPGVIVRVVDSSILGTGVHTTAAAKAVYRELTSRDGWSSIDAVRSRRVLLLSAQLLETVTLQTASKVLIAKVAYPDLFADTNPDEALGMLAEEETGTVLTGIFYYTGKEE